VFRSLRLRLALSYAFVSLVILAIFASLVVVLLSRSLDRGATDQLEAEASAQAERIQEGGALEPTGDLDVPSASAIQIAVYREGDTIPLGGRQETPDWLRAYPGRVTDLQVAGERVRVVTVPAVVDGQTVASVAAGRSLEPETVLVDRVRSLFIWGGLVALGASVAAGWWWAGRAVGPIERSYAAQAGFAADASHELRTPLTFIRAGVETLAEHDPALGSAVLGEVDYLTGLSHRLLQLARADRGRLELDLAPVALGVACRSAARRSIGAHGTRLKTGGDDRLVVPADRVALEAALDAVLENVARHGGGEADLCWKREGEAAVISIADRGPGMPLEMHRRAFERFVRTDAARARQTGGAGLGLALARALVEAQDGRMWLEPSPGGGVTAKISLPMS
jgi:signal transduction histidine kinase